MLFNPPLLLVTDRTQAVRPLPDIIADYWQAGGRWVWLREKDLPKDELIKLLKIILDLPHPEERCKRVSKDAKPGYLAGASFETNAAQSAAHSLQDEVIFKPPIILSGHADLVAEYNLAGVHLPQYKDILKEAQAARAQLKSGQLLGISIHSATELKTAEAAEADYVIAAPIFPTASKPGYGPTLSIAGLQQLVNSTTIPVIALGGISPETAPQCLTAGAQAVAVMGEFMRQADNKALVGTYLNPSPEGRGV